MTELESIPKLQYTLEFIEGAIAVGDLSEALHMARKALSKANIKHWIDIFEGLIEKITILQNEKNGTKEKHTITLDSSKLSETKNRSSQNPPLPDEFILVDDLTKLSGVGPTMALKLQEAGYHTFSQLAEISPEDLSQIKGIGVSSSMKIISSAKSCLPPSNQSTTIQKSKDLRQECEYLYNTTIEDSQQDREEFRQDYPPSAHVEEPHFSFDIPIKTENAPTDKDLTEDIANEKEEVKEVNQEITNNDTPSRDTKSPINEPMEDIAYRMQPLNPSSSNKTLNQRVLVAFQEHSYSPLHKKLMVQGIDGLVCKLLFITPSKQLLLFIPYKISTSLQKLKVSEMELGSSGIDPATQLLSRVEILSQKLYTNSSLQDMVSRVLNEKISLQNNKAIRIEPLLITVNPPSFIEKAIPFAYQRQTNLHVIAYNQISSFLEFLERKLYFIESYALSHREVISPPISKDKFYGNIRHISYLFIVYGALFMLIIAMGWYDILKYFITLGYFSLSFYPIGLIILWRRYHSQEIAGIYQHKNMQYPERLKFEEEDLILIREGLSLEQMGQFSYECFGKEIPNKFIEGIEKAQMEQMIIPQNRSQSNTHPLKEPKAQLEQQYRLSSHKNYIKQSYPEEKEKNIFKPKTGEVKDEDDNRSKSDLIKKYSVFLDN